MSVVEEEGSEEEKTDPIAKLWEGDISPYYK
jgi:hypothetical protein